MVMCSDYLKYCTNFSTCQLFSVLRLIGDLSAWTSVDSVYCSSYTTINFSQKVRNCYNDLQLIVQTLVTQTVTF